jgi:hypothetical protein
VEVPTPTARSTGHRVALQGGDKNGDDKNKAKSPSNPSIIVSQLSPSAIIANVKMPQQTQKKTGISKESPSRAGSNVNAIQRQIQGSGGGHGNHHHTAEMKQDLHIVKNEMGSMMERMEEEMDHLRNHILEAKAMAGAAMTTMDDPLKTGPDSAFYRSKVPEENIQRERVDIKSILGIDKHASSEDNEELKQQIAIMTSKMELLERKLEAATATSSSNGKIKNEMTPAAHKMFASYNEVSQMDSSLSSLDDDTYADSQGVPDSPELASRSPEATSGYPVAHASSGNPDVLPPVLIKQKTNNKVKKSSRKQSVIGYLGSFFTSEEPEAKLERERKEEEIREEKARLEAEAEETARKKRLVEVEALMKRHADKEAAKSHEENEKADIVTHATETSSIKPAEEKDDHHEKEKEITEDKSSLTEHEQKHDHIKIDDVAMSSSGDAKTEPSTQETEPEVELEPIPEIDPELVIAEQQQEKLLSLFNELFVAKSMEHGLSQLLGELRSASFTPRVRNHFFTVAPGGEEFVSKVCSYYNREADIIASGDQSAKQRGKWLAMLLNIFLEHSLEMDGQGKGGLVLVQRRQNMIVDANIVSSIVKILQAPDTADDDIEVTVTLLKKICNAECEPMLEEESIASHSVHSHRSLTEIMKPNIEPNLIFEKGQSSFEQYVPEIVELIQVYAGNYHKNSFSYICDAIDTLNSDNPTMQTKFLDAEITSRLFDQLNALPTSYDSISKEPSADGMSDYDRVISHKMFCMIALRNTVKPKHKKSKLVGMKAIKLIMSIRDADDGVEDAGVKRTAHEVSVKIMEEIAALKEKKSKVKK